MLVNLVVVTVYAVICEHSLETLKCGKITFIMSTFSLHSVSLKAPLHSLATFLAVFQRKGRLCRSTAQITGATTTPHAPTT